MPANNLVNEITSAKQFFASRAGLEHDKAGEVTLQKNFASALIQQMHCCLSLSPQDAATVHEALHDSPYGDGDTQRIIAAIDAKGAFQLTSRQACFMCQGPVLKGVVAHVHPTRMGLPE